MTDELHEAWLAAHGLSPADLPEEKIAEGARHVGEPHYALLAEADKLAKYADMITRAIDAVDPDVLADPEDAELTDDVLDVLKGGFDRFPADLRSTLRRGLRSGLLLPEARTVATESGISDDRLAAWLVLLGAVV